MKNVTHEADFCVIGGGMAGIAAALSSSRVMATCALLGQAVGTAAAQMIRDGETPDTLSVENLQNPLMADDCYLPGKARRVSPLSRRLTCSAEVVRNGRERGDENKWSGKAGDTLLYSSDTPFALSGIRLVFDSDLNRSYQNMPCCIHLHEERFKLPATLIRDFDIVLTDPAGHTETHAFRNVHDRLFTCDLHARHLYERALCPARHPGRVHVFRLFL